MNKTKISVSDRKPKRKTNGNSGAGLKGAITDTRGDSAVALNKQKKEWVNLQ